MPVPENMVKGLISLLSVAKINGFIDSIGSET